MVDSDRSPGLTRRRLLGALGASAVGLAHPSITRTPVESITKGIFAGLAQSPNLLVAAGARFKSSETGKTNSYEEPRESKELRSSLARRLSEWTLPGNVPIERVFPEVKKIIEVTESGRIDTLVPPAQGGLELRHEDWPNASAHISFLFTGKEADDAEVKVYPLGAEPYKMPLRKTAVLIGLSPQLKGTNAELMAYCKEVVTILDFKENSKIFLREVEKGGAKIEIVSQRDPRFANESLASYLSTFQMEQDSASKSYSWFGHFIDLGAFVRAGILFPNWYTSYPSEHSRPSQNMINTGNLVTNALYNSSLLRADRNTVYWRNGHPPAVSDQTYFNLTTSLMKQIPMAVQSRIN